MNRTILSGFVLILGLKLITADVYLHNIRGSNNRLNEKSANRKNANRLFDSQNNNRGGYNVGDQKNRASRDEGEQYRMKYFQSGKEGDSDLMISWTNQHGCGNDDPNDPLKLNCNIVLQFRCQEDIGNFAPRDSHTMRNGKETNTPSYSKANKDEDLNRSIRRRDRDIKSSRGLHESWEWYDACFQRNRNEGLFTADQKLKKNGLRIIAATATRQNPNSNRRGYECAEERDYYPYWHPNPWTDIAVLAHNESMCSYYKEHSFNRKAYGECVETEGNRRKHFSQANNPAACAEVEGEWVEYYSVLEMADEFTTQNQCERANTARLARRGIVYRWGKPYDEQKIRSHQPIVDRCFVQPPPVDCKVADWSRVNHLGDGVDATPHNYTWKLPHFPSLQQKRCVFRIRYNISTDDYAPWDTDASQNQQQQGRTTIKQSPVENNPLVNIGANNQPLKLAINTAQFGRTFQDRSHVFFIAPRPEGVDDEVQLINLNVRGKRGNIVQTYPAVEYDFYPTQMKIKEDDMVHIQWTGSNTHNNGAPGGDGQTGDAGEGKGGTDRHNLLQLLNPSQNFPRPIETATLYDAMTVVWNSAGKENYDSKDLAIQLASSGYYKCSDSNVCGTNSVERKSTLNPTLDQAPASYAGMVLTLKKGTYHYVCTRNNNFTNRSQKGKLQVV